MRMTFQNFILLALFIFIAINAKGKQIVIADTSKKYVISIKFSISKLSRDRIVRIALPSSYYSTRSRRYPVIYMHDGQRIFKATTDDQGGWAVDSIVNSFPDEKQAIIVGIYNDSKFRITEYNPYDTNYGKGEGNAYLKFVTQVLKPYVDAHFRTKSSAVNTVIAGSSLGGLISMYAALQFKDIFGCACVLSPAYFMGPQIYKDVNKSTFNSTIKIFQACGDQEGNESDYVLKLDSLLRKKGLSVKNVPLPIILKGAEHNEQQWRRTFEMFFVWFTH